MKTTLSTPKKNMLEALERSLGIVSTAAGKAGIHRATHYKWLKEDAEYQKAVQLVNERTLDFVESHLHTLITELNPAAIIFYLKTKGKARGYVERSEVEVTVPKPLSWLNEK